MVPHRRGRFVRWSWLGVLANAMLFSVMSSAEPVIEEPGWTLTRTVDFSSPWSARFNPVDGLIYVLQRDGTRGLYRINGDDSAVSLWTNDDVTALLVDPSDGSLFVSDAVDGRIDRTAIDATGRELWVNGFQSGDDDPVGMAIAPENYTGDVLAPGQALVVDRGSGSADGIWRWSPGVKQEQFLVLGNSSALVDAEDVAIGENDVYIVDPRAGNAGRIYILNSDQTLTTVTTLEPIDEPSSVVIDPLSGDLLIVDQTEDRVVRVNLVTGAVVNVVTGFMGPNVASIDIKPDGSEMLVTDFVANKIYVFAFTDPGILATSASITGFVLDESGEPVNCAAVRIVCLEPTFDCEYVVPTDLNGRYQLTGLPVSRHGVSINGYGIEVFSPGFLALDSERIVEVSDFDSMTGAALDDTTGEPAINFSLLASAPRSIDDVYGTVVDRQDVAKGTIDIPLGGVRVEVLTDGMSFEPARITFTCTSGSYEFVGLLAEKTTAQLSLKFLAPDYETLDIDLPGSGQPTDVAMTPKFAFPNFINGLVSDGAGGNPIENALVIVEEVLGILSFNMTTNVDGFFGVSVPVDGDYIVDVSAPGFAGATTTTTVSPSMPVATVAFDLSVGAGPGCAGATAGPSGTSGTALGDIAILTLVAILLIQRRKPKRGITH